MIKRILFLNIVFLAATTCAAETQPKAIPPFSLNDSLGATHSLSDWNDSDIVVLVFLGTECPLAKLYTRRLVDLDEKYKSRGVQLVGINANDQDTLREIGGYVKEHKIGFPVLKDAGQHVADRLGAKRTPEAFVIDQNRVVRYRGRIDDQYGVGYARPEPRRNDLTIAIDQLLVGDEVTTPQTEAVGCLIGRTGDKTPSGEITYSNQVARLLQKHCVRCHRKGQIAPFSLTEYEDVTAWSEMMLEVIDEGRMPPWHANTKYGHFANEANMPADDKRVFASWVENGMPEGDPANLPESEKYADGWQIPKPDLVLSMPEPYQVPAKGVVPYQYFELDPKFEEDTWIAGSEIRPGNPAVVHHVFVFYVAPDQNDIRAEDPLFNAIAGFAPGMPAGLWPSGTARLVPAGSRLVFQVHYTPNGSEQVDQTRVGLIFADPQRVNKEAKFGIAVNTDFKIPPRAADHHVASGYQFTQDTMLHVLIPHMHYRGKSFRFTARYPDGKNEILLDVPNYDFNWQNAYELATAKLMPENTVLMCDGVFDNSENNPANPDPEKEVEWGDQSWDEMMLGSFVTSLPDWIKRGDFPTVEHVKGDEFKATFRYLPPNRDAKRVSISGTFNDWNKESHPMQGPDDDGYFSGTLSLARGRYEYKFVVDGEHWTHDPENPDRTGPFTNSVLRVSAK